MCIDMLAIFKRIIRINLIERQLCQASVGEISHAGIRGREFLSYSNCHRAIQPIHVQLNNNDNTSPPLDVGTSEVSH